MKGESLKKPIYYVKKIDKLLLNAINSVRKSIKKFILVVISIPKMIDLAKRDDELSSYPKNRRKSRPRIFLEILLWATKNGEINSRYYQYLFDRKDNPVDQREYMPYSLYQELRRESNKGVQFHDGYISYECILRDKSIFSKFVNGLSLPSTEVVGLYEDGKIEWKGSGNIENIESIFQCEDPDLFFKGITGETGDSVWHISIQDGNLMINGKESKIQDIKRLIKSKTIIEKRIIQHDKMEQLNPGSVNTIRIGTFRNGNDTLVFNAILKIGAPGKVCDNWHFGGVLVGIDLSTGSLMPYGIQPTECARKLMRHPDSDQCFEGFKIPYFQEAIGLAKKLHSELSAVHTVGWDIAITEAGPLVIEGNDNWDFRMFQVYHGGCKKRLIDLFKRR